MSILALTVQTVPIIACMSVLITVAVWWYYCNWISNLVSMESGGKQILWQTNSPKNKQFLAYLTLYISRATMLHSQNSIPTCCTVLLIAGPNIKSYFVIKSTRCANFTNLFCHETLHVSDSSFVHHQEFIHCKLSNGVCHTGL